MVDTTARYIYKELKGMNKSALVKAIYLDLGKRLLGLLPHRIFGALFSLLYYQSVSL